MEETEQTFISWDGAELFYRKWVPDKPTDKALLLFHRGHEHSPPIRAMIFATAAFHVKLYVPFAIQALRIFRPQFVKSYVKSKMLTHDREQAARYDSDSFIFRQIAVNVLLDLHDTAKRLV